jgi:hypothetical protein
MKGRFYFADGRVAEDVTLDDRAVRHALMDGDMIRWFRATGECDPDEFWVLREDSPKTDLPRT